MTDLAPVGTDLAPATDVVPLFDLVPVNNLGPVTDLVPVVIDLSHGEPVQLSLSRELWLGLLCKPAAADTAVSAAV